MRVITIIIAGLFFLSEANAVCTSDTLLSESITAKGTLIIMSEYRGCQNVAQREVKWFYDGSRINILFFDSLEMKLLVKNNLEYKEKQLAERILKKMINKQRLNSLEKRYAKLSVQNSKSLFTFSSQYLKKDIIYLEANFEDAKRMMVGFEKALGSRKAIEKGSCIASLENCRTKVAMTLIKGKYQYEYYSDGCNDISTLIKQYFNKGG